MGFQPALRDLQALRPAESDLGGIGFQGAEMLL